MNNHKDLDAWKESMNLVEEVYKILKTFPQDEIYGLISQIRRSAISIPSNIAEGAARSGKIEFKRFLFISLGSLGRIGNAAIIGPKIKLF
jgi:four helix bundle protein